MSTGVMGLAIGGQVAVENAMQGDVLLSAFDDRWVQVWLTPEECIELSRALVKAAATALGVGE